jgi:hypothetical protein
MRFAGKGKRRLSDPRKRMAIICFALALLAGVAIGATGLVTWTAGYAGAATAHTRICWGSNRGDWDAFHKAVPPSHCVRTYYDAENVFPKTWPTGAGKGVWVLLSIRPDPADLLSGRLDAELKTLIGSAPLHSRLTIYHENAGGNPLGYPPDVHNPATYVSMQKHMEDLVRGSNVRFGVIIIAPFGSVLNWIYKGDDWFGYDFYAFPRYLNRNGTINVDAVTTRMTNNLKVLQKFTGRRYPMLVLGETNAHKDYQRKTWFSTLANWFGTHDGHRTGWILTRWTPNDGPHTGLSGPWPPSAPVVTELRRLATVYQ